MEEEKEWDEIIVEEYTILFQNYSAMGQLFEN